MATHHVVLFKIKADASKRDLDAMIHSVNGLSSLSFVKGLLIAPAERLGPVKLLYTTRRG